MTSAGVSLLYLKAGRLHRSYTANSSMLTHPLLGFVVQSFADISCRNLSLLFIIRK